ncbi:hypothetical protein [Nannocystis bainbridge]|uniref:ThuA-like domain-containing protein n=1 Tax=Nannocystis bainbridge TaxID=2995303 RepID=A0ABT5E0R9_9BACT|nr:hypothetical protein [Nannocystis bainbridge]MDC0718563.1 hypothetical protein [Nannocystis bainbridge]
MTTWFGLSSALLGSLVLATLGCGDPPSNNVSASNGDSDSDSTSATGVTATDGTVTAGGSDSDSGETDGTGSASMTSLPTTGEPTSTSNGSATSSTTADTEATATTSPVTDSGATDTDTTVGPGTTLDPETSSTTDSSTTGPDCIPTEEICNDLDDDCNGIVDDVDVGGDGICDCLNIAIFGNEGANPSAEFQGWLEAQGTQVDRISLDGTPIDAVTLEKYDIVILDWLVRNYSAEEAATIRTWVEGGGGLMSMTGHTNNNTVVDRPNSIIAPMGLAYNQSKGFFGGPVTQWTPHPITEGITSVSFYGGLYVDIVEDGVALNEVIGTLPQGPVAVGQTRLDGKLFIFGDEWIEFDSEWQQIPQIKQFWVNILAWLSPQNFCTIPQ